MAGWGFSEAEMGTVSPNPLPGIVTGTRRFSVLVLGQPEKSRLTLDNLPLQGGAGGGCLKATPVEFSGLQLWCVS